MQISLAEPFISQDSEKLCFQKSRKPQSTNVFSRSVGLFASHQKAPPFRREESLRRFTEGYCAEIGFLHKIRPLGPAKS
jgi:hypothetical protein